MNKKLEDILKAKNRKILKACGIRKILTDYSSIDFVGFNFIHSSKRFVEIGTAKEIIKNVPKEIFCIGVFEADDINNIAKISNELSLDGIQLHKLDSNDFIIDLKKKLKKETAIIVSVSFSNIDKINKYKENTDLFIVDSENPGSGIGYDYSNLKGKIDVPFLIAGGVNLENIKSAVSCNDNCIGVDIASGIETNGEIDEQLIKKIKMML